MIALRLCSGILVSLLCVACGTTSALPPGFDADGVPTAQMSSKTVEPAATALPTARIASPAPTVLPTQLTALPGSTAAATSGVVGTVLPTATTILTMTTMPDGNQPSVVAPTASSEGGSSSPDAAADPQASAKQRIVAAQQTIYEAASFVFTGSMATSVGREPVKATFIAPDSYRIVIGSADNIVLGDRSYVKNGTDAWQVDGALSQDVRAIMGWLRWTPQTLETSIVSVGLLGDPNASPHAGAATYQAQVKNRSGTTGWAGIIQYKIVGTGLSEADLNLVLRTAEGDTQSLRLAGVLSDVGNLGMSIVAPQQ